MTKLKEKQNIPQGWEDVQLGDIEYFNILPSGINNFMGTKKYLSTSSVVGNKVVSVESEICFDERPSRANMQPVLNSVWFAKMKDTLKVLEINDEYLLNDYILSTGFAGIQCTDKIRSGFLKQFILSDNFNNKKNAKAKGSTQKAINSEELGNIKILIPPINEQQKIAEILGAVDEDIAKTQEVIEAAEKLKRGLMQQLFTRGIGHTKFKKTKLGQIPEGWEVVKLEEVANVERGKFSHRPRNAPEFYGGGYPFIQTGDVIESGGRITKYTQTLNQKGLSVSRLFSKGTIVMTIAANIGDTGILEFDSCFPDSLVGITIKEGINNVFLEYLLQTKKDYLNSIATQSAQKNINLQKLQPLLVIKPSIKEQQKIAEILSAVDEKISINKKLKEKFTLLKKGLMQDLLSGRVRVRLPSAGTRQSSRRDCRGAERLV